MEINTIIHCLLGVTAMDCLNCPHFAKRDGGITYCRGKRLSEARKIVERYQKIEQIYSDYLKYMNPDNLADRIGEVLEGENDDN